MPFLGLFRRTPAVIVLVVLAVTLNPAASPAGIVTVDVFSNDFGIFNPATQTGVHFDPTISVGDTIHWAFQQGVHNTQSTPGQSESWMSQVVFAPATFDHLFTNVGDFQYSCQVHSTYDANGVPNPGSMIGIIHVVAVPEPGLILGISAVGMALGGWCARRRRRSESRL